MKREQAENLFAAIGEIDEEMIIEAEVNKAVLVTKRKPFSNLKAWSTVGTAAAILIFGVWLVGNRAAEDLLEPPFANTVAVPESMPESDVAMDNVSSFDRWIGDFWLELTAEQIAAVFPLVEFDMRAMAAYYRNGDLFEVTATFINDHWLWYELRVGYGPQHPCCVMIGGEVPAIIEIDGVEVTIYQGSATFMLGEIGYLVSTSHPNHREIISQLIAGGPADLSVLANPEIPEMWSLELTFEEAQNYPIFGSYVPHYSPAGFDSQWHIRHVRQGQNDLHLSWRMESHQWGSRDISWSIQKIENQDMTYIHRYWQPLRLEELSLAAIQARTYYHEWEANEFMGTSDGSMWIINFSIYFEYIWIDIHMHAVTAEEAWQMVQSMPIFE